MAREFEVKNFDKGLITRIEDFSIPEQAASNALNWLTLGDRIELSGGYKPIGTENTGLGEITGLAIGTKVDGTSFPIRTHGKKVEYYDGATEDWVESGTDQLGTDADGEHVAITFYTSLAGYQAWISSSKSSLYKMMLANPDDIKDMFDTAKNFKGYINAQNGRLHLWNRENNKNYLYGSYKDLQNSTVYTDVSAESVGAAPGPSYSGTLTQVTGKRTCFNVVITDGTKTLTDDKNGAFTGDGTGTINYATGAYSVTFDGATVAPVTADYSYEDSTSKGLADFTFSSPRVASEGFFLPQSTGGDLLNIMPYRTEFYCIHEKNAWLFSMPVDDLSPTNQIFRDNIGMENWRAAVATGDGIFYIDTSDPSEPRFKILTLDTSNDQVIPLEISFNVDLSSYSFDKGVGFEWGDYILFAGRTKSSTVNNRVFAYHKIWKSFDVLDYLVSSFADFNGFLWSGDSATDNVYQLFTGFAADTAFISNYWEGKLSKIGVDELKKFKRLTIRGQIGSDQTIKVSLAYDGGNFTEVGLIESTGAYVDMGSSKTVGSPQVGSVEVGGGGSGISAFNYRREFRVRSDQFDEVKIRFEATNVGYASVSNINFFDIKTYGQKNIKRFRTTS